MRYIAALFIIAGLLGCLSLAPPTDEEIERNRAAWEAERGIDISRSRALWERALAEGAATYTVYYRTGGRDIVSNVELEEDRYCGVLLASRGTQRHNDYWLNYDHYNAARRSCAPYGGVARIEPGDARSSR